MWSKSITRLDSLNLEYTATIDDPEYYTQALDGDDVRDLSPERSAEGVHLPGESVELYSSSWTGIS